MFELCTIQNKLVGFTLMNSSKNPLDRVLCGHQPLDSCMRFSRTNAVVFSQVLCYENIGIHGNETIELFLQKPHRLSIHHQ